MPRKGSVLKVNVGWALIVAAGIGSFILVRNSITNDRKEALRKQKALRNEVKAEVFDKKN